MGDRDDFEANQLRVSALAINVDVPDALQWKDSRRGEEYVLTTLNIRLLPSGHVAAKAYGRPVAGGRGGYTSFRVPDRSELAGLIDAAATRAGELWTHHKGLDAAPRNLPDSAEDQ
ncbi:hypothetical protein N802_15160 [Knoellia sinensis KCTC 19936]|uniref:Uncharacterized protein n=1 Tax=Knoellia sinensis KCTC 19936 TaxID=1385520 RepID=A0A0A0J7J8_9MICO|nr:hypothetical protein [Knoellia sinensis]KGN33370.1 hypothetical protein N802_15160 [Knoellia sinensis KCTC 19936]